MLKQIQGGVCAPKGFTANGVHCGIRKNKTKRDLALIFSEKIASASAVYTQNLVKGAPLTVLRYGYADGFLRKKNNGVCGYENNANNLCMDACVRVGEGEKGTWLPVLTDAAETARITGTISYEVLCAATRRAEMVYDNATFCGR